MINMNIWRCKRIYKRIENLEKKLLKFQFYVKECKKWIREEKRRLNKELKKLTEDEVMQYGIETGYIEKEKK